jgi:hypothetical protein
VTDGAAVAAASAGHRGEPSPGRKRDLWICWWVTVVFYVLFGVIFVPLTRLMPPPGPGHSVAAINAFFHDHALGIRIGFALLMVVIGFGSISNGLIAYQMSRMSVSKVFAYGYIATLAVGALPGCLFAAFMFLAAVFRPGTDPQTIALLYDMAFLTFVGSLGCFTANYLIFGLAVLMDENGIFPKWLAYVAIWQVVTELLAVPVFVFRKGPYDWNGVISFWEGTIVFGVFLACLIMLVRTAIQREPTGSQARS